MKNLKNLEGIQISEKKQQNYINFKNSKIVFLFLLSLFIYSCSNDLEEDIINENSITENGLLYSKKKLVTPDFTPIISVSDTSFFGNTTADFDVVVDVQNIGGVSNGTPVEVRIVKSSNFSFTYDSTLTSVNGITVNNSEWAYNGSHPALHRFVYIGNGGVFNGNTSRPFGLNALYNCPANVNSQSPLKVTVRYNSGGEQNNLNNDDWVYLTCLPAPDFTPTLTVSGSTFLNGTSTNFNAVAKIENIGGESDGTTVEVRIVKSSSFSFTYDNTLTSVNGTTVNNSEWAYNGSHPALHKFVYIGNGSVFQGNSSVKFGLEALYNCPANVDNKSPLKVTVKYNSGGEQNNENNNDLEYMYCNL